MAASAFRILPAAFLVCTATAASAEVGAETLPDVYAGESDNNIWTAGPTSPPTGYTATLLCHVILSRPCFPPPPAVMERRAAVVYGRRTSSRDGDDSGGANVSIVMPGAFPDGLDIGVHGFTGMLACEPDPSQLNQQSSPGAVGGPSPEKAEVQPAHDSRKERNQVFQLQRKFLLVLSLDRRYRRRHHNNSRIRQIHRRHQPMKR